MFSIDYLYTIRNNFGFIFLEKDHINLQKAISKVRSLQAIKKLDKIYLFINDEFPQFQDEENNIICYKYFDGVKNKFAKFYKLTNLDIK